jgi:hypothetical protein
MMHEELLADKEPIQRDAVFSKPSVDGRAIEESRRTAEAEKTARLRALRLAKEAEERAAKTQKRKR